MAFYAVPDVLEKGKIIDYQKNWKGRMYDTCLLYTSREMANLLKELMEIKGDRAAGESAAGVIVLPESGIEEEA